MWKKLFAILVLVMFVVPLAGSAVFAQEDDVNLTDTDDVQEPDVNDTDGEDDIGDDLNDTDEDEDLPEPELFGDEENETEEDVNETEVEEELEDAGVTPDSFMWGVDKAIDRLSYLLTVGPEARAKKGLAIALERHLELKAMCEAGKIGPCTKAQEAHTEVLEDIEEDLEELDGDDSSLETELEIEEELKRQSGELERMKSKIKIKGELTEEQQQMIASLVAGFEGKTQELKIKVQNKQEETKIKIKARTGLSEEEIDSAVAQFKDRIKAGEKIKLNIKSKVKGGEEEIELEFESESEDEGDEDDKDEDDEDKSGKGKSDDDDEDDEDKLTGNVAKGKGKK